MTRAAAATLHTANEIEESGRERKDDTAAAHQSRQTCNVQRRSAIGQIGERGHAAPRNALLRSIRSGVVFRQAGDQHAVLSLSPQLSFLCLSVPEGEG